MGPRYEYFKEYFARPENLERKRKAGLKWYRDEVKTRRKEIIKILGAKCSNPKCLVPGGCTDIRCLQLDHIEGGGYIERRKGIITMYRRYLNDHKLLKKKIQLLCANCNWIKVHVKKEFKPRKYK